MKHFHLTFIFITLVATISLGSPRNSDNRIHQFINFTELNENTEKPSVKQYGELRKSKKNTPKPEGTRLNTKKPQKSLINKKKEVSPRKKKRKHFLAQILVGAFLVCLGLLIPVVGFKILFGVFGIFFFLKIKSKRKKKEIKKTLGQARPKRKISTYEAIGIFAGIFLFITLTGILGLLILSAALREFFAWLI